MLLNANWENKDFLNITLKRGSLATSYGRIADALGMSVQNVRTAITHLKETKELTVTQHSKFLEISINNYDRYQQANRELTGNQQATNRQLTTTKELKKLRKKEYIYARARGSMNNIDLTDEQYMTFKGEYPEDCGRLIDELSEYKAKTGAEYAEDYPALLTFARRQGLTPQSEKPDYRIVNEVELMTDKDGYEVAKTVRYKVYPDGKRVKDENTNTA